MRQHQFRIQTARKTAEALVERFGIHTTPVDVQLIATKLGLPVVYHELGADISGLLMSAEGRASICVRDSDPLVRQRFTIAHEIGHFVLRHQFEPGAHVHVDEKWKVTARSTNRSLGVDPQEVEANQFAAALLMPSNLLRERAQRYGERQLDDQNVAALAREFKVSEQAMVIRLSTLGL